MRGGSDAIQAWNNVASLRRRGVHCLTLFRFGKRQGSGNSKNATALRHIDNANGPGGVSSLVGRRRYNEASLRLIADRNS
jgi:hypothetical protein